MAETAKVRNIVARLVVRDLGRAGLPPAPLLREAGLQAYQINRDDGWLPYVCHARLLEVAAREFSDPFYGLNLARSVEPRDLGALAYVGLSSRTLAGALENLERYMTVATEAWSLGVQHDGRSAILNLTPTEGRFHDYQQAAEAFAAGIIFGYQFFLREPLAPQRVRFVHARRPDKSLARYEELLGCPVEFGSNRAQIVIDRQSLGLAIGTANDRLLEVLKSYCDDVLKRQGPDRPRLTARVQETVADLLPSGRAKAKLVAGELGMTVRTMHRRLADEETTFSAILDQLRRDLAEAYMKDAGLSLQKIAFLLGYADQSAFSVAFRRWTGRTPKQARSAPAGEAG